jgi:hypothetical protein
MFSQLALLNGIDRSRSLAESALPHAPCVGAPETRSVRPAAVPARGVILRSR